MYSDSNKSVRAVALEVLSEQLRDIMRMDGRLSEFVLALLVECGYCPRDTIKEIVALLREMEEKSDFECNKVRADRLMEREKYLSSIYEYKRLLESDEAGEQSKELIGNIWHNLGTAYARLFLFGEASHCYDKAYKHNGNQESLKESLLAQYCLHKEDGLEYALLKNEIEEPMVSLVRQEIENLDEGGVLKLFENRLEAISKLNVSSHRAEYRKAISEIIFNWKEEYRRICRI